MQGKGSAYPAHPTFLAMIFRLAAVNLPRQTTAIVETLDPSRSRPQNMPRYHTHYFDLAFSRFAIVFI